MNFKQIRLILITVSLTAIICSSSFAIKKVAPSMSVFELSGGIAQPIGTYDQSILETFDFNGRLIDFDAANVYDNGINISIGFGKLINKNWQVLAGFNYIKHDYKNPGIQTIGDTIYQLTTFVEKSIYRQYDLDLNLNYLPKDLKKDGFSPYLGLGIATGFAAATAKGYQSQSDATIALRANFGAEIKVWKSPESGSFLTIASINSYDFYGSATRAKHLQIGAGIRFYSR